MPKKSTNSNKFYRRYLKTLASGKGSTKLVKELLRQAPTQVLKLLSNAAIIASRGNIKLSPSQKSQFAKRRKFFTVLGDRSIPIEQKREYLVQSGGAIPALVPILLSAVIPIVGELILGAIRKK